MTEITEEKEIMGSKEPVPVSKFDNNKVIIMWVLVWLGLLTGGITTIVAVIWAYIAKGNTLSKDERTHYNFFISMFWWTFLWSIISIITSFILIGFLFMLILSVWYIYKAVVGTMAAIDNKPIYTNKQKKAMIANA